MGNIQKDAFKKITLKLDSDGSLIDMEPRSWLVCFVPGLNKQWWHKFVNRRHKHAFAMRFENDRWTLFEPWWTRLLVANITNRHSMKYLLWADHGDVLLVREAVPGHGSQVRGWMNCAALVSYLLGCSYFVWTPHGLYRRLKRDPSVCRIDMPNFLHKEFDKLKSEDLRITESCDECRQGGKQTDRPFCINCGRYFE